MTKICEFRYPIYDLTKNFDILLMIVAAGTVVLNIIYEGLLLMVLSIMMKKKLLLKKHTQFKTRVQKPYTIYDQNGQLKSVPYYC